MTGTREYILFTRGPPVNDLFPGDPQLRYGDPGVPFHPRAALDTPLNTRTYLYYLRVRQAAESVNLTKLREPLVGTAADSGVIAGAGAY